MGGPLCFFNSLVLRRLCPWLTLSTSRLQVEDPKPAGKEEERILADPVAKDGCLSFAAFQKFRFNTSHSCSGERWTPNIYRTVWNAFVRWSSVFNASAWWEGALWWQYRKCAISPRIYKLFQAFILHPPAAIYTELYMRKSDAPRQLCLDLSNHIKPIMIFDPFPHDPLFLPDSAAKAVRIPGRCQGSKCRGRHASWVTGEFVSACCFSMNTKNWHLSINTCSIFFWMCTLKTTSY